jgi:hypothetical protein
MACVKPICTFQRPRLIGVIKMRFSVVRNRFPIFVHNNERIVVLGGCRPVFRYVDLLGIPSGDYTVVLESGGSSPKLGDTSAGRFEKRGDVLQGLEVVTYIYQSVKFFLSQR